MFTFEIKNCEFCTLSMHFKPYKRNRLKVKKSPVTERITFACQIKNCSNIDIILHLVAFLFTYKNYEFKFLLKMYLKNFCIEYDFKKKPF